MVIVPARLEPVPRQDPLPIWAIEPQSLTWDAIAPRLPRLRRSLGFGLEVVGRLESFTALVQVARAGFAHALVPIGVARELGVPHDRLVRLGDLSRPIAGFAFAPRCSFAVDRCRAEAPGLEPAGASRSVACWEARRVAEASA